MQWPKYSKTIQENLIFPKLAIILVLFCGCAAALTSEQQAIVDTLYIATHEIPGHARRISLSPEGILEVESTKSQSAYDEGIGNRTFLDVHTGRWIWNGTLRDGQLITDSPSPVIVETRDDSHTIIRYDRNGGVVWKKSLGGLFIFGLAQEDHTILLTLSLASAADGSIEAVAQGTSLTDGDAQWHVSLGPVSLEDYQVGSLWRYHDRLVFSHLGKAYLLLENKAFCISMKDGRVLSSNPIHVDPEVVAGRGRLLWLPAGDDVIVVTGAYVHRLSERTGRQWSVHIGAKNTATGATLINNDVIISYDGENERGLARVDAATSKLLWKNAVRVNSAIHPDGIAVANKGIFIATAGQLHCFSKKTGEILFSTKIRKTISNLFCHENNIVLTGATSIELRNSTNGDTIWEHNKLDPPLAWFHKQKQSSMAAVSASMEASATIAANRSRFYFDNAGKKTGGTYAYDPWTRYQYTKIGRSSASSAAISKMGAAMTSSAASSSSSIDRLVSIIVDMQVSEPVNDHVFFLVPVTTKVLTGQTNTAKLLAVDLVDGSTTEIPVRKAPMTCIPAVMVNERLGLIIEAYHKFPFCGASRTIDILKLPPKAAY